MVPIIPGSVIGIIGGGQLGRMTALAAARLGYKVHIYCDHDNSPAAHVSSYTTVAPYDDEEALLAFAKSVDVVTFEFENIPTKAVELLEPIVSVRPNCLSLYTAQNRLREKQFLKDQGIPTAAFKSISSAEELKQGVKELETPSILKTVENGYDGKGQVKIFEGDDLDEVWQSFGADIGVLELFIPFKKEISSIVARSIDGRNAAFPVVENEHKDGILDRTIVPADILPELAENAIRITNFLAEKLDLVGLLTVEFFVTESNTLLVNEMAPRPHNSGHWTKDACVTSQFEQLVRAICNLPFGSVKQHTKAVMTNLIGDMIYDWQHHLAQPNISLHLYGKDEPRPGRKMGHIVELIQE